MRLSKILTLILMMSGIGSCIDPFIPETASYDKILYIECLLDNDTSRVQKVRISHSTPIISATGINSVIQRANVSGALVEVIENNQLSHIFMENNQGSYLADPEFKPKTGNSYRLKVTYDGNIFESDVEIMKEPGPIDSISYKHAVERVSESSPVYDGYRFYVSSHQDGQGPSFFRWDCDVTYFFRSYFDATHIWDGRTQLPANNFEVKYCWTSNTVKGIYVANTEGLAENRIVEAPLHFQSQYGDALSIRYSLNVKQHVISEKAWQFWQDMGSQINHNGGMYDTQPFRIEGNIRCITDSTLMVTGIFEASGLSEKRIFVNRPSEFEIIPVTCTLEEIGTRDLPWYRIPRGSYIIFDFDEAAYFYSNPQCFDCTLKNGTLEKPAFWEDGY